MKGRPLQLEDQGNAPTRETVNEELAVRGLRLRAFVEEKLQGVLEALPSQVEMRRAEQDAQAQYMLRQLVQAWDIHASVAT